jgi:transposase-like protein
MNQFIRLSNDNQAKALLRKQLKRIYCPSCRKKHYIKKLSDQRYYCARCRYKFSLKALLGFKGSKLAYVQILKLIFCFSQRKTLLTAMQLAEVSYPTARLAYFRIRGLLPVFKGKLAGDIICDECFVGKQRTDNQAIVAGAVDRGFTTVKLQLIPDRQQDSLEGFLYQNVTTDSLVTTDAYDGYWDIKWYGYGHQVDNHSKGQLKKTVPIERVWSLFKTLIRRTYHHIWKEKLNEYLVEFEARFNHREIVNNPLNLLTYLLNPVPSA